MPPARKRPVPPWPGVIALLFTFIAVATLPATWDSGGLPMAGNPHGSPAGAPGPEGVPLQAAGSAPAGAAQAISPAELLAFVQEVISLTNLERANAGLPSLLADTALSAAAQAHSQDMADHDYVSHTGSDGSTYDQRIAAAGYGPIAASGENVAAGYPSPNAVVAGWMASPLHRANILSPLFTHIGVGYAYDPADTFGPYYHYWTQTFGARCLSTSTPAATATTTLTPSSTPTATATATLTPSSTPTATTTATRSAAATAVPSSTPLTIPTATHVPSATPTAGITPSPAPTCTASAAPSPSATRTRISPPSPTATTPPNWRDVSIWLPAILR